MLTYSFSDIGSDSLYHHLYKCLRNDILQGVLLPGEKLPSKRTFAKNLGISVITVENAYAQLIAEGFLYSLPKKGYFIADVPLKLTQQPKTASMQTVRTTSGRHQYLMDFSSSQTDPENFPFSIWAKLIRELLNSNQKGLLTSPPCGGLMELREAIAEHLKAFRNMNVSPEQIIIGAGTEYLYGLLIQLLGFDKCYAVENPGYQKISAIYKSHHVSCRYLNMDKEGILISELEKKQPEIVHISPAHHFPTGIVMPISRRYELLAWAFKDKNRYIIEDDYDSEFRFNGQPIPTLQSIDCMEKVIYINTFTKSLASTIRISYMVLPPHLVNKFYQEHSFYSCTVSNFEQYTLYRFMKDGYFEKHINRMRKQFEAKRNVLLQAIKDSPLSDFVTIMEENAGLHFLIKIQTTLSDAAFSEKVLQHGVKILPLSTFYAQNQQEYDLNTEFPQHIFIVNYSSIQVDKIPAAIHILYQALR